MPGDSTDVCVSIIDKMIEPVLAFTTCIVGTTTIEPTVVTVLLPPPANPEEDETYTLESSV